MTAIRGAPCEQPPLHQADQPFSGQRHDRDDHHGREDSIGVERALGLGDQERAALAAARERGAGGLPAPAAPAGPLAGRDAELAGIGRLLAGDGPPVLLLAGEPGIGKSRLLEQAARQAGGAGWTVLRGGCQRRGEQEPYAPLVEALAGHIKTWPPAQARASLRGCA